MTKMKSKAIAKTITDMELLAKKFSEEADTESAGLRNKARFARIITDFVNTVLSNPMETAA